MGKCNLKSTEGRQSCIMHSVSAISTILILVYLKYASCWNTLQPPIDTYNGVEVNDPDNNNVTRKWFRQRLDHFDPNEKRTYFMKYFQRLDFWQPNGPIILYMMRGSSEFKIYDHGFEFALAVTLAKETHGALFNFDQRYYQDFVNLNRDKNYFKFLNTTQSLADIAEFVKFIKTNPLFESSKVIVLGMEQLGTLATWFRMLYPDLADAVVAVSAPLLAKKDFKEYFDIIDYGFDKYGTKDCLKRLENHFHWLGDAFDNATELEDLKKLYHVCDVQNFTSKEDRQLFMNVRYDHWGNWERNYDKIHIKAKCLQLPSGLMKMSPSEGCYPYQLSKMFEEFWKSPDFYQSCSEFGRFPTTTADKQPFVDWSPLEYFLSICKSNFDVDEQRIDEGISETNRLFGGLAPNVTNVVFTWSDKDPYRLLGVQKNLSDSAPAFVMEGQSITNVLFRLEKESKETTETRNKVKSLVKKWISSS